MNSDEKFLAMEEQIADLTREVVRLQNAGRGRVDAHADPQNEGRTVLSSESGTNAQPDGDRPSRRQLLGKAGLVAGAAATGLVLGGSKPAAAGDGNHFTMRAINTATDRTELRYLGATGGPLGANNILTVQDGTFATTSRASAIAGWASANTGVTNGVYGWSNTRVDDNINTGHGVIAYRQFDVRSHLYLKPDGSSPKFDSYAHTPGELRSDNSGNLWHCTKSVRRERGTRSPAEVPPGHFIHCRARSGPTTRDS